MQGSPAIAMAFFVAGNRGCPWDGMSQAIRWPYIIPDALQLGFQVHVSFHSQTSAWFDMPRVDPRVLSRYNHPAQVKGNGYHQRTAAG
jgi:hypothetical protein